MRVPQDANEKLIIPNTLKNLRYRGPIRALNVDMFNNLEQLELRSLDVSQESLEKFLRNNNLKNLALKCVPLKEIVIKSDTLKAIILEECLEASKVSIECNNLDLCMIFGLDAKIIQFNCNRVKQLETISINCEMKGPKIVDRLSLGGLHTITNEILDYVISLMPHLRELEIEGSQVKASEQKIQEFIECISNSRILQALKLFMVFPSTYSEVVIQSQSLEMLMIDSIPAKLKSLPLLKELILLSGTPCEIDAVPETFELEVLTGQLAEILLQRDLTKLKKLSIWNTRGVSQEQMTEILNRAINLRSVDLHCLPEITKLYIELPKLQDLYCGGCYALESLTLNCPELHALQVINCSQFRTLGNSYIPQLIIGNFGKTQIIEACVKDILRKCKRIQFLDLHGVSTIPKRIRTLIHTQRKKGNIRKVLKAM